ncbi:nose resistant to fluoxetine protein 6-like isoform X2 [Manduca sexta]|uniref:nose resistant to fluoxetine protein 6-like isoform X2 n=1 Tax=Manduca sexta TaxID=7130 RepID=UPI00188FD4F8|nr:nose resistant to fluoxetine protein 6-like isoform X2 [Manduca sexta]
MDHGPLWRRFAVSEQDICVKNWWRCLLMLNTSAKEMCLIVAWYISCDFHLTAACSFIIYVYRKNKKNGLRVYGIACLLAILIPGFLTYWYKLQPVILFTIQDFVILRMVASLDYVYVKTYSRGGPYVVGMAAGYLITKFNREKYKKVIPKIWSFSAVVLAVSLMLLTMSVGTIFYDREYSALEVSISVALDRVVWAFAVCSIVGVCIYGDLPIINDFLSWSLFRPLGRLSYGIYLLHAMFLERIIFSTRAPLKYDHLEFYSNQHSFTQNVKNA